MDYKVGDRVIYSDAFGRIQEGEIKEVREEVRKILGRMSVKVKRYVIPDAKGEWMCRHPWDIIELRK